MLKIGKVVQKRLKQYILCSRRRVLRRGGVFPLGATAPPRGLILDQINSLIG